MMRFFRRARQLENDCPTLYAWDGRTLEREVHAVIKRDKAAGRETTRVYLGNNAFLTNISVLQSLRRQGYRAHYYDDASGQFFAIGWNGAIPAGPLKGGSMEFAIYPRERMGAQS